MASKTGKLVLTAVTGALLAGCGTQPMQPTGGMTLGATADGGYGVLAKRGCATPPPKPCETPNHPTTGCETPYTIYVHDDFDESGSSNRVVGSVHVNDDYKLRGNRNAVTGEAEVVGRFDSNNNKHSVMPVSSPSEGLPVELTAGAFAGETIVANVKGDLDLNKYAVKGVIQPGVYIATGKISLSGKGYTGNVTLIASEVHIAGNSNTLTPYALHTLALAGQAHVSGNGNRLGGLLQVKGELQWSGHQNALQGAIVTEEFKLSGSDNEFAGTDDSYCAPSPAPTATPTPTPTPTPSASPSVSPSPEASVSPSASPGGGNPPPGPEGNPTPSPSPSASTDPTPAPSASTVISPSPEPTPAPTATPNPGGDLGS